MSVPFDDTDPRTVEALMAVKQERQRQERKWGEQRHGMTVWLTVLQEEVGEAAQAILQLRSTPVYLAEQREQHIDQLHEELVQIAAVAVAWLEHVREATIDGGVLPDERWA